MDISSFTACPDRNPAVCPAEPGHGGSPSVLGRDGPPRRGAAARDRDPAFPPHGHQVRARPDRADDGHDQTSPPSPTPAKLVPARSQLADTLGGGGLSI